MSRADRNGTVWVNQEGEYKIARGHMGTNSSPECFTFFDEKFWATELFAHTELLHFAVQIRTVHAQLLSGLSQVSVGRFNVPLNVLPLK